MKKFLKLLPALALAGFCLFGSGPAHSQESETGDVLGILTQMRDTNKELINKQTKTMETLEDLAKQAGQLRLLGRRT